METTMKKGKFHWYPIFKIRLWFARKVHIFNLTYWAIKKMMKEKKDE